MQIVYSDAELSHYMKFAVEASPERPVLVDKFLEDATEVDVDCIADVGLFQKSRRRHDCHRRDAGAHRICRRPFRRRRDGAAAAHAVQKVIDTIREYTHAMARELKVVGLMNVQYAVKGDTVYVLEVNPRASRTVPFVSKAIGVRWPNSPRRSWRAKP
jgi:carbamoyl-phosphate synthase large subunit